MTATRWQAVVLALLGAGVVGWFVWSAILGRGGLPPQVPWTVAAVLVLIAGIVLRLGLQVRQYQRGKKPDLDAIRAARTAVLAKAAAYTGGVLAGWYGAQTLVLVTDLANEPMRAGALSAGGATGGAVVLAVVGLVVERFCRLPPPGDEATTEPGPHPA
ncbi:MAG: DUF3180 domain-containing protein [Actinomycetales bacterium]|nr:DUF3180 domain-containing protein [Actinomycetales bacterium]